MDYVPAKAPVLMGHHFSSIAGAGPINGPIQAAVFGWVPVMLWVLIGGIFFGAVHDFGALFASVRNKGQSIGEVIAASIEHACKEAVPHLLLPDPDPGSRCLCFHRMQILPSRGYTTMSSWRTEILGWQAPQNARLS